MKFKPGNLYRIKSAAEFYLEADDTVEFWLEPGEILIFLYDKVVDTAEFLQNFYGTETISIKRYLWNNKIIFDSAVVIKDPGDYLEEIQDDF